jgi:hypothetical protein
MGIRSAGLINSRSHQFDLASWVKKLTPQQVLEIRTRRAAGERVCDLAQAFSVTPGAITRVCSGENHREVSGEKIHEPRPRRVKRTDVDAGVTGELEVKHKRSSIGSARGWQKSNELVGKRSSE